MSVQELILKDAVDNSLTLKKKEDIEGFGLRIKDIRNRLTDAYITREHAHLIMLYLQEHLK